MSNKILSKMAIIQGITGGLSGKMGNAVFRQRHGETVITQYQSKVANPKSDGQTLQRARFKLVSQLGSLLDGFIAIPRDGAVSARNQFAALNNGVVQAKVSSGEVIGAQIDMLKVKLTKSSIPFGSINTAQYAQGQFVIHGFGTLAVTNRPERRANSRAASAKGTVSVVVIEAPFTLREQPPRVVAFGSSVANDGTFSIIASPVSDKIEIDFQANAYVALCYETLPVSASAEESFDNILAEGDNNTALAIVAFSRSVNYQDIITSDTLGALVRPAS